MATATASGTAFGAAAYPTDTVDTLAQRFVNAINSAVRSGSRRRRPGPAS